MPSQSVQLTDSLEDILAKLPLQVRGQALQQIVSAGARKVQQRAKKLVSQPGYEGDKPNVKALRDTIGVVNRFYNSGQTAFAAVGPQWPAGAHGHLVEFGHEMVRHDRSSTGARVEGKEFMAPAADQTRDQQVRAMDDKALKLLKKHGG